jgi:hypothetical protein
LQQGTYAVSSAPVQSGISTVCPGVDHVTSNTGAQQQYSTSNVQHTPPSTLWGSHTFRPTCSVLVEQIYGVGALNMYYYLVLLCVYPITYPVVYVEFDHGDLWFLHQGVIISLSHHTRQIDIVVNTTINLPSIVVVDVVQLLDVGTIGLHDRTDDRSERWSCDTSAKPDVCLRVDSTNL